MHPPLKNYWGGCIPHPPRDLRPCNSVSNFTGPRFKLRTSRSRDEGVTALPAKELISVDLSQRPVKSRALLELLSCVLIS